MSHTKNLELLIKSLRIHQWSKNLLIFAPAVLGSGFNLSLYEIQTLCKVYISFSLVVSSSYIVNDLTDIDYDKKHPKKKFRPIATGLISNNVWRLYSFLLFFLGNIVLISTNQVLIIFSITYFLISTSYTLKLKYLKYFDMLSVSILFLIRLTIGSESVDVSISNELYIFVFFTSLGILLGKKYSILNNVDIKFTKFKKVLSINYKSTELVKLMYFSFICSSLTYLHWIVNIKYQNIQNYQFFSLLFSFVLISFFYIIFINETKKNMTEDIFLFIKENKVLVIVVPLFIFSSILGVL